MRPLSHAKAVGIMTKLCLILLNITFVQALMTFADQQQLPDTTFFQVAKQWKLFTYNFEPHAPIINPNFYSPKNILATGVAVSNDRIFIATPKLFSGVSSTLNVVSKAQIGDSPVLHAYPDWSFSTTERTNYNCSDLALTSVYRLRIDSCNRLWVLDAGVARSLEDYDITCPPKILIIDLNTDQVVRRIDFPREVLRGDSLFTNMVIDETTSKSCDDVYVYITDTVEPAIIVYDSGKDVTWRLSHPSMYPDPDFAQSEILNDRFVLMDGIVGLAFDEKNGIVYFQPLATERVFSVNKNVLRDGPLSQNKMLDVKLIGKKSSQGIGLAVSPYDQSLIFAPLTETAIATWNPATNHQTVLAYDRDRLQFIADITTTHSEPGVIYVVSSKFHRFFLKNLNELEVNNRIIRIELPQKSLPHYLKMQGMHVTHNNEFSYGLGHMTSTVPLLGSMCTSTNALQNVFSGSNTQVSEIQTRQPFKLETDIFNFNLRNPFTALNRDEPYPPTKASRELYQHSFLDSLVGGTAPASTYTALMSATNSAYYHQHGHQDISKQ